MRILLLLSVLCCSSVVFGQNKKLSASLNREINKKDQRDSINFSVSWKNRDSTDKLRILFRYSSGILVARVRVADLNEIVQNENILFINEQLIPKEELTTGAYDLSLNRINLVHARLPQFNGDSLQASVKERLFDSTDIDLKGRVFKTGLETTAQTSHASLMATIIAGAGNSSPYARGAALKANLSSSSFLNLLPDPDSIMQKYKISLQNHSYGTVVENFYGNEAVAYDRQANQFPNLLHVFSSGNSGNLTNTSGPYAGVSESANLTGNFKQAKNIITVGSIDSAAQLMPLSSKGPAYDGRIKPELMAYGEDGSSGAAALVSGTALLVQDAYKKNHAGNLPSSALVRSILINSADDVGNPNPDYASGYGSLNAYRAMTTIVENRFLENTVVQNEIKTFPVNVPAGIAKLKLTLTWNDPAALPNASKSLVNDLDMILKLPATAESWQPWVLSAKPNIDSLQLPAKRGADTLNNIEQISIDNPLSGLYNIEVRGSGVNTATQNFSISYQFDSANIFYWTYPTSNDHLLAENSHWLRWQTNLQGAGLIEYATNGNNWRTVGTADLSEKYFTWPVPDTITNAVLRMRVLPGNATIISDSFTISPQLNMQVGFNCTDSFLLYWNPLHTGSYRLYELATNYLQPFAQTPDTGIILTKQQHQSIYYAVAPLINGKEGLRSATLNYTSQGVECYLQSFFLQSINGHTAFFTAQLGSLYHVADVSFEKFVNGSYATIRTVSNPASAQFNFSDSVLKQGTNLYRLKVTLQNGMVVYSNAETVYFADPGHPVVLYPNPVRQTESLKIVSNESGRYTLNILDNNGRLVYSKELNNTVTELPAGLFAAGVYFVRITDKQGGSMQQKIVVY
jgi:hypothetical protein